MLNEPKRGRPPIYGVPLRRRVEVPMTDEQCADLKAVAKTEGKSPAELIRDAINSYVQDFRETALFDDGGED